MSQTATPANATTPPNPSPQAPHANPSPHAKDFATAAGGEWHPKILAFLCNWCSYAGADLAGVSRLQYGPNVRIVRVPCSARVNPQFIMKALQNGADGVLVSGCHPGDCHYISGNLVARRKFALTKKFLEFVGVEPERVQFSWVSASEGKRFSDLMNRVIADVRRVGPASRLVKPLGSREAGCPS